MFKIILDSGLEIENIEANGNNFISKTELTAEMFNNNLGRVTIVTPDGQHVVHTEMKLLNLSHIGKEWWFILEDMTQAEIREQEMQTRQNNADAAIRSIMNILAKFKIPGGGK